MDLSDHIKFLVMGRHTCVLATVDGDQPYCSLMNYAVDEACRDFYMITLKHTKKYRNLLANPRVSLMVDTRDIEPISVSQALTVEGLFEPLKDDDRQKWVLDKFISINPSLHDFIVHPDAAILRIRACSFLLLQGLSDAHYMTVD
jgi:nitroimidazol reductase NimA-like FMN-containing flavoprotein (pyridoxamine 5'-phosphate oxidase superfamily)